MAITKVTSGLISADASSIDLNIDAGTLYLDVSENRVGIGTTSPAQKLDVQGTAMMERSRLSTNDGTTYWDIRRDSSTGHFVISDDGLGDVVTIKQDTGNVGIGTTSPLTPLHVVGANGLLLDTEGNGDGSLYFGGISGQDRSYIARSSNDVLIWNVSNGPTRFGTNNTEAMRILNGGQLVLGGTSNTNVSGNADDLIIGSSTNSTERGITIASTTGGGIRWNDGADSGVIQYSHSSNEMYYSSASHHRFVGNVGIAQSSPAQKLDIFSAGDSGFVKVGNNNGSVLYGVNTAGDAFLSGQTSGKALIFETNNTERMRLLESNGSILMGKSANSIDAQGHWFRNNGESFHTVLNTDNTLHVYDTTNNLYRFYVTGGGTINATSTSITAISDERLKENIVDLETGLSEVMSLQPRRFDWKNGDGENVAGFIAQEVETVLPDLIEDYKHEELKDAKALRMGDMIPTLVKAIQEQQTIIDDLKTRIETLENA